MTDQMSKPAKHIAVLGAGAWGTALARLAALNGNRVTLWCRDPAHAEEMRQLRQNNRRLPGIDLPYEISPTSDLNDLGKAEIIILAIPSAGIVETIGRVGSSLAAKAPVVIVTKGLEANTGKPLSEVVAKALPDRPIAALSGPSFAADVAAGLPTAVTLAAEDEIAAVAIRDCLARAEFRIYLTNDLIGTELGGAAKNVLAIAAGIVEGMGLGASAKAALIARGFAELSRLVQASGGQAETVAGLSGLGDLVLTCSSTLSRNYSFGIALGRGQSVQAAIVAATGVVEGAQTAPTLAEKAAHLDIEMPITDAVAAILSGTQSPQLAVEKLLARPLRNEF